jgi:hypothetical protein
MTCHEARAALSALLDDELTRSERGEIEAHLAGCPECRRDLEGLRQTAALLHRIEPARAPRGFVERVVATARPRPWYRRVVTAAFLPLSVKLPAEATAVVMVSLLALYAFERSPTVQQAARLEGPPGETRPSELGRSESLAKLDERAGRAERLSPDRTEGRAAPGRRAEPTQPGTLLSRDSSAPAAPSPAQRSAGKTEPAPASPSGSPALPRAENRARARESAETTPRDSLGASGLSAKATRSPADVIARVVVKDREVAGRELGHLVTRVGGSLIERRRDGEAVIVEALIPRARYPDVVRGLASLGPSRIEFARPDLPAQIRILLRVD